MFGLDVDELRIDLPVSHHRREFLDYDGLWRDRVSGYDLGLAELDRLRYRR